MILINFIITGLVWFWIYKLDYLRKDWSDIIFLYPLTCFKCLHFQSQTGFLMLAYLIWGISYWYLLYPFLSIPITICYNSWHTKKKVKKEIEELKKLLM